MQSEQQQRIMGYFIEEAKDHLNTLEQGLLNLQSTLEDPEMVNELFRAAHSVKGGAAMLGIDSIHQTSHRLEDCFKILKEHPVKVDHEIESLLLTCLDTLQELLEQLQSPFGLTEDKSREIMSGVEPVFTELGNRLTQLVAATGGVITPESQDTWIAPEAVAPASTPVRAEEESALQLIFQSDVPRQLRDMLQLFKQADTLDRRQQLQEICSGLKRTGEQFDLRNWCELLESARLAIASPENTYHTLAPIVIREIKQGQELVLAGRSSEIAISPALQELLPIAAVSEDLSFDAMFAGAEEGGLDLSAIADGNVSQAPAASVSDLDFHKATGDRPGPEVGVAELNSLADLFEGDVPDLDITWEQEEILGSTTDEILSSLDLDAASDFSDDFADLLFEESADSNSNDEDDLSGFLQAAERRAEPLTTGDLDFDLGDDDSADIFGDLLEPKPAAASNGAGESDEDLGDLFAEIDAVDLEAETPKTVGQPAPELAALGSLFGEMPVDDAELMTDLNEAEPSIFDEADDLLQGDFGGASGDGLSDLGFEDDLLFAEAQSSEVTEAAEPQADLDFSGDLFDEPGDTDDFLDLGLEETEAIAPEEEALGNLLSNRTSPQRTDQLGAAESSELANLFGEPSFDESSEESELTDNLFDTGAEAVDELEEVSLDAFADLSDDAASPAEHQALIGTEKPEAEETEAALEASDDFSALEWDTSTEALDFSTDETEEPEAENPEAFADTSAETTDFALTSPELAWDALESEHEAADAAIDEALGIASFDLGEDMWDMPLEQGTESTEPTASTNEPSAEAINEPSEAIALNEWDLNLDAATESPVNLEADLFDESDVGGVAPSTGEDWDNFFESSSEGDRSNVASDEIADFFGAGAAETEREATSLGDFGSTMDFLSEETDQPAAEVSASLEEDLWASEESPAEAATTATEDLELGLGNDDLSAFDLSSETSTEEAPGLDFTTTNESGDSFEMSLEIQPEALNLDLESSFDEPSDLDFGLEGLTEEPAPAATIDFDLGSEPSDSLALGTETAEPESLDFNLGTETAAIADEFDLGLDATEEPEALDFGLDTEASDDLGLDFGTTEPATDELDFGPEATEASELSFDLEGSEDFGLELAETSEETNALDFDLELEPAAETTADATDELDFGLDLEDESDGLSFETAATDELDFDLDTEGSTDEFDLGLDATEEPEALDFGLDTEASDDLGLDFGTTEPATDELDFGPEATEASELSFDLEGSEDFGLELAETSEETNALDFDLELEPAAETTADATDELDFGLDLEDESDDLSFETAATDELDFGLDTEEASVLDDDLGDLFGTEATDAEEGELSATLDFGAETTADATDELDFGLDLEDESDGLSFEAAATDELDFGLDTEGSTDEFDLGLDATEEPEALDFGLDTEASDDLGLDFGTTEPATDELDFGLDLEDESDGLSFETAATDELDFGLAAEDESGGLSFEAAAVTDELDFGLDTEEASVLDDDLGDLFGTEATDAEEGELSATLDFGTETTADATDELDFGLDLEDESGGLSFEAAAVTDELDFGLDTEGSTDEFDLGLDATEEPEALDFGLDTEASDDLGLDFGTTEPATDELDFGPEATEASELSFDLEGSEDFGLELAETSEETNALDFDLELEPAAETTADATDELDFGLDLEDESDGLSFEAAATDELDFGLAAEDESDGLSFEAAAVTDELDFGLDTEEASVLDDDLGDLFGTEATDAEEGEWSATLDFGLDEEPVATANDFSLDVAETSNDLDFGLDEADSDLAADLFGVDEAAAFEDDLFGPESADVTEVGAGLDFDEDLLAIADEVPTAFEGEQAAIAATETIDPEEVHELESLLAEESGLPLETSSRQVFDELAELLYEEAIALPETTALSTSFEIESEIELDNEFADLEKLLEDADNTLGPSTKSVRGPAPTLSRRSRGMVEQTMRVPVKHLDNLNNLVGELVVNRNSLEQDQERLRQFLDNLLYQVQQLSDVGQRMRDLYERSLLESSLLSSRRTHQMAPTSHKKGDSNPFHATGENFDALEMDRFTSFHTLSQEMIELIVRVREASSDIEYIVDETDQVTRSFRQVTTQLQEGLNRSRMVPFAQIADRLPRAVRDIAMKCGKQAELVIEGRDTLIDKMILEQLYDPMTHLVNNAITHGIEAPDVRKASGKAPTGRITVRAFHQGNQTVISVSDDGAGIPVDRVKAKAVERGLVTPVEAKQMSRLDVYDLLFHPGFSIRDKADDFAGRGIGMDVVRTSLNEIRGAINTDSTLGRGTSFTIRLPLTLSISKALCCISNHARIAFPMDGVEDMLDLPKDRVQTNPEGQPCILWRDTMLPFRPLTELLRHNRFLGRGSVYGGHQDDDIISIVVLRSAGTFIALQVDQVLGEQEIVIKQLEGPVPKPAGVAGATVLGDGRIMPIADVLELIDLALGRARRDVGGTLWEEGDQVPVEPPVVKTEPTVLIVDDSITVRELLSMTFNKSGYRVEQARDGQEAWEKLRSGLPCDLVFCDIEMPRMDGLELLSRMQKDPALSRLPIAMLTSRGADRHRQMAVQLGARGYFTKPYLEEALLDAAQRMLKGEVLVGSK